MNTRSTRFGILFMITSACFLAFVNHDRADDESGPSVPAVVKVEQYSPIPMNSGTKWSNVPDFISDATIYEKPASKFAPKLQFEVQKDGIVLMVASWSYDGNATGGWKETRWTDEMLVAKGWVAIGQIERMGSDKKPDPHVLYRRMVKSGEKYEIHTRKYNAPLLILPSADHVKEVLAAKSVSRLTVAGSAGAAPVPNTLAEYQDEPTGAAVLVGLRFTVESYTHSRKIGSIQAIYETSQGRSYGKVHGVPIGSVIEVEAKPDYAIGGLTLSTGKTLTGLGVTFSRRSKSGLDRSDTYSGRWIGDQTGASDMRIDSAGRAFVGIRGTLGDSIRTIELIAAKP